MHFILYTSKDAAMKAADEWTRNVREDWTVGPRIPRSDVDPGMVQPYDRPRLTGARLTGFTVRAEGDFARYGQRYAGRASNVFAAAWEAPL